MSFKAVQLSNPCRSIYSLEELCVCVCVCQTLLFLFSPHSQRGGNCVTWRRLHGRGGQGYTSRNYPSSLLLLIFWYSAPPVALLGYYQPSHTHTQNFNTHTPNETKSQCITRMRRLRFIGLRVAVVASRRLQHRKKFIRTRLVLLVCV